VPGPASPDPNLPDMLRAPLERRIIDLEKAVRELQATSPIRRASMRDANGVVRLRIGFLDDSLDGSSSIGIEVFDATGESVVLINEDGVSEAEGTAP